MTKRMMDTTKTCRKAEFGDYLVYFGANLSEEILQGLLETEVKKSNEQRDFGTQVLLVLDILGCGLVKLEVNSDLCIPIGNTASTYYRR